MTVAVADVVRVIAEMSYIGQRVLNVYEFLNIGSSVSDEEALLDVATIVDNLYALVAPDMSALLSFTSVLAKNLDTNTDLGQTGWPTLTVGAQSSANTLPTQVAGLITFPTDQPRVRGRKFIPAINDGDVTGGLIVGETLGDLVVMGATLLTALSGDNSTWQYVVLAGGSPSNAKIPTDALVTNVPSTLTRRRIGTGE